MKKKFTTTYIEWEELDDEIWNAIVDYTHETFGDMDGHIQFALDNDNCIAYFSRSCKRLHKKDKEKDK